MSQRKLEAWAHRRKQRPQIPFTERGSNHCWGVARCLYPAKALLGTSDIPETTNHVFLKNVTA